VYVEAIAIAGLLLMQQADHAKRRMCEILLSQLWLRFALAV
jgi:hypothetical protein